MQDTLATFVNIILPLNLNRLYTYRVPEDLSKDIAVGKRVSIQFGKKKVYSALIHSIHHQPPKDYEAKYILGLMDEEEVVFEKHIQFWEWIASYYICNLGDVMNAALPAPFKLESETRIVLNPSFDTAETELDDREFLIIEALQLKHELTIHDVTDILQVKNVFPILKSLVKKEAVLMEEELEQSYKAKTITCIRLDETYAGEEAMRALFDGLEKHPKQLDLLMAYIHLRNDHSYIEKSFLVKTANATESPLKTLIKKGVFHEYKMEVDRIQLENTPAHSFTLNDSQQEAMSQLKKQFEDKEVVLLHGVTSSGKTHIYVRMIEEALARGEQVLYLLPEIALTSQIVHRIRKYFGSACISFHSKFSDNERVEIWQKVKKGHYKIVIGARSAIFLPFEKIGLVIVDEEHEQSYKQNEPAPRYHARDAAIYLASHFGCKTILGSATPSFETYYNCRQGKFGLVEMRQRFGEMDMPEIETANIAEENRVKTMHGNFTSVLLNEMQHTLSDRGQIILFQNRRGYAPVLECENCRWIPKCQNCDISLTYHKYIDSLKCHYCGFTQKVPANCQACGSHLLTFKGFGTEKIEDELKALLPEARVSRLDMDAARTKFGHEQIIHDFAAHKSDILVGTQMLSKGLDFEKVRLAGIINADQLLYFPDFRAHERAYQLISQVSGRAGRRGKRGKVIIQTNSPNHHVIHAVISHDYEGLFERELEERKRFLYPPYMRIIRLVLKHKDHKIAERAGYDLRNALAPSFGEMLLGPESPYVSKIRNFYIRELLIKLERNNRQIPSLKHLIRNQMQKILEIKEYRSLIIFADVDPA